MTTPTLIEQLRALARCEHGDMTLGDDAADEIERLQSELAALRAAQGEPVAPTVLQTIGALLSEAMERAVANGANSVSMPDQYVELAAWLASPPPAQPTDTPEVQAALRMVLAHYGNDPRVSPLGALLIPSPAANRSSRSSQASRQC